MRKIFYFFIILALVLFLYFLFLGRTIFSMELDARVEVAENFAINLGGDDLNFGKVIPGGSLTRSIEVINSYPFPVEVFVKVSGDIESFLNFDYSFLLEGNRTKDAEFFLFVPNETLLGEYSGRIFIEAKRV
jgi:hypothetical protein